MNARIIPGSPRAATFIAAISLLLQGASAFGAASAFAAPAAVVQSSGSNGVGRMVLSLLVVLALLLGGAWLMKRMALLSSGGQQRLRVLASISLGARERAVLIEVDGREVLLGVAPGQVRRLLKVDPLLLEEPDIGTETAADTGADTGAAVGSSGRPTDLKATFSQILRRSLGR